MHAVFILYGDIDRVQDLITDLKAQRMKLKLYDSSGKYLSDKIIRPRIQLLPFGIMDIAFPKEYADIVLSSLDFHKKDVRYEIPNIYMKIARKVLKLEKIPDFKVGTELGKDLMFLGKENVAIIPLGVRYDIMVTTEEGIMLEGI